ncbi:hypothetical protein JCM8202_005050 [Rhodotorula sphaerocarpa]
MAAIASAASIAPLEFKILPPSAFAFAGPLFALAVLLQPAIPARISRPLRAALAYPAVHAAWFAPYRHRHEPAEFSIAANFRWGIFAPYAILLAVWWAFMSEKDRTSELVWVGFDGDKQAQAHGKGEEQQAAEKAATEVVAPKPVRPETPARRASVLPPASAVPSNLDNEQLPTPAPSPPCEDVNPPSVSETAPPPADLATLTAESSSAVGTDQRQHPAHILLSALHLLSSMRGVGYVFGPPMRHLPGPPTSERQLVQTAIVSFVGASAISTVCIALQTLDRDGLLARYFVAAVPFLPLSGATFLSALTARISVGLSLWVQMKIGFSGLTLGFWLLHHLTNRTLDWLERHVPAKWHLSWRSTFDPREFPPLFNAPFSGMGEGGCTRFWSAKWHFLFRAVFTGTLYSPATWVARRLGIPKRVGALAGAFLVFAGSAWMHWRALVSSRADTTPTASGLAYLAAEGIPLSSAYPSPWSDLTVIERYGTWIFFLSQPVAIVLEQAFTVLTRRRIGGLAGRVWTVGWIVLLGEAIIGRSWLALGLAHGVPPVERWGWQRWVMPTYEMAPMPAFMRSA